MDEEPANAEAAASLRRSLTASLAEEGVEVGIDWLGVGQSSVNMSTYLTPPSSPPSMTLP
jgi:hypothetical protein